MLGLYKKKTQVQ